MRRYKQIKNITNFDFILTDGDYFYNKIPIDLLRPFETMWVKKLMFLDYGNSLSKNIFERSINKFINYEKFFGELYVEL